MIQVRPAATADAPTIAEFCCAVARETEGHELERNRVEAGVRKALTRLDLCRYYMAELDRHVVGQFMITYEWSDWRGAVCWWLQSVYVRPEFRRRGVFEAMFRHIEAQARRNPEVCGLRLYCNRRNLVAIRAYERLGMRLMDQVLYDLDCSAPPPHP
jgi:GNAT superfamily N-acetyltransferase